MATSTANANPDKSFFVESITKDISLMDCVLDLIDNSIDSASAHLKPGDIINMPKCLDGTIINIHIDPQTFSIRDNAKGIALKDAENFVFRFGTLKKQENESIGYYGIGLKRATFKMGTNILVTSKTRTDDFSVTIEIEKWKASTEWTFPIEVKSTTGAFTDAGVDILVTDLYPEISETFDTPSFKTKLIETIARDYYFFFRAGLIVNINTLPIAPASLELKDSDGFSPGMEDYLEDDVHIKIISGCHSTFEQQNTEDAEADNFDPKISGWYVICNNRIILAANKDDKTIWKGRHENFTYWHPQYNGFVGFIFFNSNNPRMLPWTTTKRYVDLESNIYRRALPKMLAMTKPWIKYTQQRKVDIPKAREVEEKAQTKALADLAISHGTNTAEPAKILPSFPTIQTNTVADYYTHIAFKVEKIRADKSKVELGQPSMANSDLGKYAFEYFYKNEIDQ